MNNFLENNKLCVAEAAAAAGQTTLTSDTLDMKGFDTVTFATLLGDVTDTSVLTLTIQHGDESDNSDMEATTATTTFTAGASDADSKLMAVELTYPLRRYARAVLTRGTADAVVGGIIAIQGNADAAPVTQDATVIASAQAVSALSA